MRLRNLVTVIAASASLAFALSTAWAVTVTGFSEQASLDVSHFEAGAGNWLLIARFIMALCSFTFLLWLAWMSRGFRVVSWLLGLAGLAAIPIFQWSCESIQRWAPNYSEPAFRAVLDSLQDGEVVQADAVLSSLGPPLVKGLTSTGDEAWSYSYMPSGGFGWDKRILVVQQGVVVSGYSLDEP